jgi:hypothetical protein
LPDPHWQPPAWWPELDGGKTVVLINQGTIATDSSELLRPSLTALEAEDDLLVIAVTGGPDPTTVGPLASHCPGRAFHPV